MESKQPPSWLDGRGAVPAALTLVQLGYAGYFILCKAALSNGANRLVFAVYRDIIALLILGPLGYFSERKLRTPLTREGVGMLLVSGLTGIYLFQVLCLTGLTYTSTAFTAAMQNSIPVFAFIIGVLFRVEVIHYSRRDGQAQVLGVVACISGAMVMTSYQGPALFGSDQLPSTLGDPVTRVKPSLLIALPITGHELESWTYGSLCLVVGCICMGVYVNLQRPILKKYPAPVSITALAYLIGALLLVFSGLFLVEKQSDWVLTETTGLIAVAYAGIVNSAINFSVQTCCCYKSGPILVTIFAPLQTIFATLLSLVFFRDTYYLGSMLGGILVLAGLCMVTWGQAESSRLAHPPLKSMTIPEGQPIEKPADSLKVPLLG
ncbi:hypothetical protein KC19_4G238000 [Ceratodon purpureus]|uniref:WAT1-related protein n=1 Tax=Ceratodon purpureus TaxID=3225 RepID=A0A8T0IEF5_CERPU|nr:hypothetical protein KC19_4G238000 [Ceratodon purpureus]